MKKPNEIIKDLRQDRDLKQEDIAKYLGISRTAYGKYELGQTTLTSDIIIKLARFYNVTPNFILNFHSENKEYFDNILKLYNKVEHCQIDINYLIDFIDLYSKYKHRKNKF